MGLRLESFTQIYICCGCEQAADGLLEIMTTLNDWPTQKLLRENCFGFFVVVVFSIESLIILTIAAVSSDNKTKKLMNCESDRYDIKPTQP